MASSRITFRRPPALLLTALALACNKPSDDGDASGTDTGTASTSAPATTSDTGDDPTTGADSTSTSSTTSAATTGPDTSSTTAETTGGLEPCTLEHHACAFAGQLGDFEDCGLVDPWNHDAAAWQAAHDCALAAASMERAFKLITILQGIDSDVGQAWAAQEARSYALSVMFFDGDPCGGGGCGPVVSVGACTGLTATDGCTVEPGVICLTCEGQSESTQLCGPP